MTLHPDEYHAHPAMSATRLKAMATGTALDYWAKHVDPERDAFQPTDPMRQGSLVDCLLTEPTEFHKRYAVLPADAPKKPTSSQRNAAKPSEATVLAIAWWDQWLLSNDGKEVVNEEWIDTAHAIAGRAPRELRGRGARAEAPHRRAARALAGAQRGGQGAEPAAAQGGGRARGGDLRGVPRDAEGDHRGAPAAVGVRIP